MQENSDNYNVRREVTPSVICRWIVVYANEKVQCNCNEFTVEELFMDEQKLLPLESNGLFFSPVGNYSVKTEFHGDLRREGKSQRTKRRFLERRV